MNNASKAWSNDRSRTKIPIKKPNIIKQLWKDFWTGICLLFWIWPKPLFKFERISIPLVRRIYPQLIAEKLVSVQPMLEPSGLVHYLQYRYAEKRKQSGQ